MDIVEKCVMAGVAIALAAGCAGMPNLTPVDIAGTTTAEGEVAVVYGVRNTGTAPAIDPPGPDNTAETHYYLETADGGRQFELSTAFVTPPGAPDTDLAPGETLWHADATAAIPDDPASFTKVCVEVDRPNAVAETNEGDNVACGPFPATGKPDLIINSLVTGGTAGDTASVVVEIRNVGIGEAPAPSMIRAFWSTSSGPQELAINTCPVTYADIRAGGRWTCPPGGRIAGVITRLGPADSEPVDLYVLFPEGAAPSGAVRDVEFVADACPTTPGAPAYCSVDERNETNNRLTAPVTIP